MTVREVPDRADRSAEAPERRARDDRGAAPGAGSRGATRLASRNGSGAHRLDSARAKEKARSAGGQYADVARSSVSSYVGAARDWAAPRTSAAREWAAPRAQAARTRVNEDVVPRIVAARDAARETPPRVLATTAAAGLADRVGAAVWTGIEAGRRVAWGDVLAEVRQRGAGAYGVVRNGVTPAPPPRKRRGRSVLLLAVLAGAAGAGWRVYASRNRDDSWDLPPYSGPPATAATASASTTSPAQSPAPVISTAPTPPTLASPTATTPTPTSTSGEASMSSPSSTNPTEPDATDPLDNPTRSDITAASTSPTAIRSEEGPGISDTDDPAARARAGDAGKAAFEQAAGPDADRV